MLIIIQLNLGKKMNYKKIEIYPYIELMLNIYILNNDELIIKVNRNMTQTFEENYFIIRKKWMDKFKQYFDYNKFTSYIKMGNIKDIKNRYLNKNYNSDEIEKDIMELLPNDYINNIDKISKDKERLKKIYNADYYSTEFREKNEL